MSGTLLAFDGISKSFGALRAVRAINAEVKEGEVTGLIGPNGAGKSTLFAIASGFVRPDSGSVMFGDRELAGLRADKVTLAGIARTFQVMKPLADLTVAENVLVGAFARTKNKKAARVVVDDVLDKLLLVHRATTKAKDLTLAEQKRLEVAKALATQPRLLLLDEVMAGLSADEIDVVIDLVRSLVASGTTVWLTEHNLDVIRTVVDHLIVMDYGEKIADGPCDEVLHQQVVIDAYMGTTAT